MGRGGRNSREMQKARRSRVRNRRAASGAIHDHHFDAALPRVFFWPPAGFCSSGFGLGAGLCCPPPFAMLHRPFEKMGGICE